MGTPVLSKPLKKKGMAMIEHVYKRTNLSNSFDKLVVATQIKNAEYVKDLEV